MLLLYYLLHSLLLFLSLLLSVAYLTLAERKILSSIQRRVGPNVVGPVGLFQPLADGLKLFVKQPLTPIKSNSFLFYFAPFLTLTLSIITWAVFPFNLSSILSETNIGILYILGISSIGVYGIISSGWSSNSKYALLGGLRSASQMISYEVSIGIIIICFVLISSSYELIHIIDLQKFSWNIFLFYPLAVMLFISGLAETNRPPFDLPEAEAELVAGYFIEYSSFGFAYFFIGEYANIIGMSMILTVFLFGAWVFPFPFELLLQFSFGFKLCFVLFSFVWIRTAFPRYRYDQLMRLGWKSILPLSLAFLLFYSCFFFSFHISSF